FEQLGHQLQLIHHKNESCICNTMKSEVCEA
ncbi:transcriptional regulator, partial [Mammaliicoccus vitulinus]